MFFMYSESHWRADRAAEGDGLENRCVSNGTGGSNPSPSALICVATLRVQCRDTFCAPRMSSMGRRNLLQRTPLHHPYHNTWDSPQQHEISYNPDGVVLVAPAGLNLGLWDMWCCFFVPSLGAVAGETGVLSGFISTAGLDRVCW